MGKVFLYCTEKHYKDLNIGNGDPELHGERLQGVEIWECMFLGCKEKDNGDLIHSKG